MGEGFDQLLEGVRGLGAGGGIVFAVLWWLERRDRLALAKAADEASKAEKLAREVLLRESITTMSATAGGLKENVVVGQEIKTALGSIGEIVRTLAMRGDK